MADDAKPFPLEEEAIKLRREAYGLPIVSPKNKRTALALSGGGIRSATFSLGLLRGLSKQGVLHRFDYLSTVSGGGYVGAFFCGLFVGNGNGPAVLSPAAAKDKAGLLGTIGAKAAIDHLRQSGRFMAPRGGRDLVYALALLARNWMAITLVIGVMIVLLELISDGLRYGLLKCLADWFGGKGDAWHWPFFETISTLLNALPLWVSPLFVVLVPVVLMIWAVFWAYWLTLFDTLYFNSKIPEKPNKSYAIRAPLYGTAMILCVSLWYLLKHQQDDPINQAAYAVSCVFFGVSLGSFLIWQCARPANYKGTDAFGSAEAIRINATQDTDARQRLSVWQSWLSTIALGLLILGAIDCASYALVWLYANLQGGAQKMTLFALPVTLYAILVPFSQKLIKQLDAVTKLARSLRSGLAEDGAGKSKPAGAGWSAKLLGPLTALLAVVMLVLTITLWGSVSHLLAWGMPDSKAAYFYALAGITWKNPATYALIASLVFAILAFFTSNFINLSSLATFYGEKLRDAYLGARMPDNPRGADLELRQYYGYADDYSAQTATGAPVHLINVTINATKGKGPQTVQQDRHGINLAISPQGFSTCEIAEAAGGSVLIKPLDGKQAKIYALDPLDGMPRNKNACFKKDQYPGQSLPLSSWIGISGAAFTTGLGQGTSIGRSILACLANLRLGFWWRADRYDFRMVNTYRKIRNEMLAEFPGTDNKDWYLSDGGHFENTAVYELLRRKVPFIVISDNGCDPNYVYEDLANLVRKARIDFAATIEFIDDLALAKLLNNDDLNRLFASPRSFKSSDKRTAVAMLAKITYADNSHGTLLVIKPKVHQTMPEDLTNYAAAHGDFPQQSTLDLFYDEAQWESYNQLGYLTAEALFRDFPGAKWQPSMVSGIEW